MKHNKQHRLQAAQRLVMWKRSVTLSWIYVNARGQQESYGSTYNVGFDFRSVFASPAFVHDQAISTRADQSKNSDYGLHMLPT